MQLYSSGNSLASGISPAWKGEFGGRLVLFNATHLDLDVLAVSHSL